MKTIKKETGSYLIDNVIINENSLYSTVVEGININKNKEGKLEIRVSFTGFSNKSKFKRIVLIFIGVEKFNFYYDDDYFFYNVSNYKLLELDDGSFYLSLDPDESTEEISDSDLDYIYSKELQIDF